MTHQQLEVGLEAARADRFRNLTDAYRETLETWILEVETILEERILCKPGRTIITADNKPAVATLEKTPKGVRLHLESEGFACSLPLTGFVAALLATKITKGCSA